MSTGSTVPAVVKALVTLFQGAGVTGMTVIDGPDYDSPGNFLAVGWDHRSGNPAVLLTRTHMDPGGVRRHETYDVSCLLAVTNGDGTVASIRDVAYTAFGAYDTALTGNPRLAGLVILAEITDHEYTPTLVEVGAACNLRFTVQVQAVK